jgi:hypothetical protein
LKSKREGLWPKNPFSDLDIYLWNFGTLELSFVFNGLQGYTLGLTRTYHQSPRDTTIPNYLTLPTVCGNMLYG